ncbi:S8 family serine peptidase [Pseudomonas sp. LLC-1]|uniref:S8 family serine peptidase n=1 Tax=Pseudomonas sp. LLC-1 TaxID=1812180 RepID=UPI0013047E94|nr:S8 family serine peptidase [Pseudomonas sp. LLC-1]
MATSGSGVKAIEAALLRHGQFQRQGAYRLGQLEDSDIKELERLGQIVEVLPSADHELKIGWLEPEPTTTQPSEALGAEEPVLYRNLAKESLEYYIVQFYGPLSDQLQAEIEAGGVALGSYVPEFAYKVKLTEDQRADLVLRPELRRIVPFSSEQTLRRLRVVEEIGVVGPDQPQEEVIFDIKCHDNRDLQQVVETLKADTRVARVEVGRNRARLWLADGAAEGVVKDTLGRVRQISVVERFHYPTVDTQFVRAGLHAPAADAAAPGPTLGKGELIGVADTGVDRTHPDFGMRIKDVVPLAHDAIGDDPAGHGTHVCGIIAGDGSASGHQILGIAPAAELFVQVLADANGRLSGIPVDLNDLFQEAYDKGVRIHNNSWGALAAGLYTIDAYEVDQFVHEHPDFLIVIAAGNAGQQSGEDSGLGRIAFNSLQSPATAKNALSVGASCSPRPDGTFEGMRWRDWAGRFPFPKVADEPICGVPDVLAAFSSRGPTDESRIKPDLVAPGTAVVSARSAASLPTYPYPGLGDKYCYMSGTSMAAPAVSASAALLRRWFVEKRGIPAPSAALLKAALINGCQWLERDSVIDETVGRPNFHQGFGLLDLDRVFPQNGFDMAFEDILNNDEKALKADQPEQAVWRRRVTCRSDSRLSVTLAWTDPPAHGLQHNLDLIVIDSTRMPRSGNEHLSRVDWQKFDRTNNVEQVSFDASAGVYVIQVTAQNTLFGPQGFAIVVTGDINPAFT